jgi:hypothetical protein
MLDVQSMETSNNELGCKIFLEAGVARPGLIDLLAEGANTQVSSGPTSFLIRNEIGELELRRNDDRDEASAREYPDGFLHFRSVIEFYPRPTERREDEVNYIASLLDRLWSSGLPAVASCNYEDALPHRGGYRDPSLPWPSAHHDGPSENSSDSPRPVPGSVAR